MENNTVNTVSTASEKKPHGIGRPITKENARQYQLSAAAAKKRRKEARAKMLEAMTTQLDLGDELVKAFRSCDEKRMNIVEKALRIIGLHFDQGPDAIQNVRLESKNENKNNTRLSGTIEFVVPPKAPAGPVG